MVEVNTVSNQVESSRAKYRAVLECSCVMLGQVEPSRPITECSRVK